jgi:DNA repair exonuclease SbcCD nuclease subunit
MPLTFIHAADYHLGAAPKRLGADAARQLEESQFSALEKTGTFAKDHGAAFVLICGDLFDSRNPSPRIITRTISIFDNSFDLPVFILPGTHDFLSDKSPYAGSWPDTKNVTILNHDISSPYYLLEFNCHLYFNPNRTNRSTTSPILGLARTSDEGFHIGLAHGSLAIRKLDVAADFPIRPEEIAASKLDYLALGHWHTGRSERYGRATAAYSGIPQPLSFADPESGSILLVHISDGHEISAKQLSTSQVKFRILKEKIYHPIDLIHLLEKYADLQTVVKVELEFSDNFHEHHEVDKIIQSWISRYLVILNDDNKLEEAVPTFVSGMVEGDRPLLRSFFNELERLREGDSQERAHLYEQAAVLGSSIIRGDDNAG